MQGECGQCGQCGQLLREFTGYREQVVAEKEAMRKEVERLKQQLDKFMTKIDKRVDSRIQEERLVNAHHLEKLEHFHQQELGKAQALSEQKDRLIDELRAVLRDSEREKRELVQTNTKVLVEMGSQLGGDKQEKDKSYWELMKMYQFLIEENNQLKKEMYHLRRGNLAQQDRNSKDKTNKDRSLLDSAQKPKSPTVYSSKEAFNSSKSFTREPEPKERKKVPKPKQTHK